MWFTENPWPPIIIFGALAAMLCLLWMSQSRRVYLVTAILMFAACVGTFFLERLVVTDGEQVEARIVEMTDAFRRLDVERTLDFFAAGVDEFDAPIRIGGSMIGEVHSLNIKDVQVELVSAGSRARSHFRANGVISAAGVTAQRYTTRWLFTWQKEAGEWKVIKIQRLHPLSGEDMYLLSTDR